MIEAVFWISAGAVAFSYAGYPLLMVMIGRRSGPDRSPDPAPLPTVAVLVAAYNEEKHIEARILNLLELDYDPALLRIYIGSDGSSDRTAAIASSHASGRVRVFPFAYRRGKASVINDLMSEITEEIVVFTDANTFFDPGAVHALVRNFSSPDVGAVSGELRLGDSVKGDNRDSVYWRLETMLKKGEAAIGGLLGANGGIYAIRRELFAPIPADTIIDDFTIVMNISASGYRTLFEPTALAYEDVPDGIDDEFRRRIRIGIGNYQAFFRHPEYWLRASWLRRFTYISHKVIRWFTPHLSLVVLVVSALLAERAFFSFILAAQVIAYTLLGAGMVLRSRMKIPRILSFPLFVFALNLAFLVAFWRYITGNFSGQWRRTERA